MSTKINQFINVTGATADTAKKLLNACAGNLELAIGMYMEDGAGTSDSNASTSVDRSPVKIPDEDDEVRPPILPVRGVLVEDPPPGRLRRRKRNLPASIFDPFRDVASEIHSVANSDSSKTRATLAELYRPPLELMFQGNFNEAKQTGAALKKWLLVNVQDSREFSSHLLNRDVWNNSRVKNVLENNFLLWQTYRGSDEASRFCQFYAVRAFPFVAVLDPRTGELVDQCNEVNSKSFLEFASEFLSTHSLGNDESSVPQPKKSRIDVDSPNFIDLSEEDQLKAAIAASMSQKSNGTVSSDSGDSDADFVLVESDEEDCSVTKCSDSNNLKHSKSDATSTLDPSRLAYLNMTKDLPTNKDVKQDKGKGSARRNTEKNLPLQKLSISDSTESVSTDDIHLLLRLPAGTRVQCSFKENHPVQELFDIVAAQGFNVEEVEIIANFPRRVITMVNCLQSFKDVGLNSRETVFVQIT